MKSLYVDDGKTAEAALTAELSSSGYDCIMVGAGLRIVSPYFLLFEKLINVIHRHAPASTKICFNTNPSDTADAVRRWVKGSSHARMRETLESDLTKQLDRGGQALRTRPKRRQRPLTFSEVAEMPGEIL